MCKVLVSPQQNTFLSPLRYPGGKAAIADFMKLILCLNGLAGGQYVEIYAGGAGVVWSLLLGGYVQRVCINDISKPLYAFWHSVLHESDGLCKLIFDTPVTVLEWQKQRAVQSMPDGCSLLELGFSTFFLNRTNRSGILNGGVIGGKGQNGKWRLDARFNKKDLVVRIQRIAEYSNRVSLYNLNGAEFIENVLPSLQDKSLVYLDPPYYLKGQKLYENHYSHNDHVALASLVSTKIKQPWIVSYDATPVITALYEKYRHIEYDLSYSAREHYAGSEIMFFSPDLIVPRIHPARVKKEEVLEVCSLQRAT